MRTSASRSARRGCAVGAGLVMLAAGCSSNAGPSAAATIAMSTAPPVASDSPEADAVAAAMDVAMSRHDLRSLIVRVTVDGNDVYTGARGESLDGVPTTVDMHVRIGSVAFSYIGLLLAMFQDRGLLDLDDPLSDYLPEITESERVTLRMLAHMTAGYADYVYTDEMSQANGRNPFRQFDTAELTALGLAEPMMFEPGTNWGYSHTNYTILAAVLEKVAGRPMSQLMQDDIITPMALTNTTSSTTPAIPEPVLQAYSSERRAFLGIAEEIPFYEAATPWNPSWTTATGAVMTSDIRDLASTAAILGSGALVSPTAYQDQVGNTLAGFGERTDSCPVCRTLSATRSYGLGVLLLNGWITQTMNFAGQGGSIGYLPDKKVAVAVVTTYTAAAFAADGSYANASDAVLTEIAAAVTDHSPVAG